VCGHFQARGFLDNILLKRDVRDVRLPRRADRPVLVPTTAFMVEVARLGLYLDQLDGVTFLNDDVGADEKIVMAKRGLEYRHAVAREKFVGLVYGLVVIEGVY